MGVVLDDMSIIVSKLDVVMGVVSDDMPMDVNRIDVVAADVSLAVNKLEVVMVV